MIDHEFERNDNMGMINIVFNNRDRDREYERSTCTNGARDAAAGEKSKWLIESG